MAGLVSSLGVLGACSDRTGATRPLAPAKSAASFAASPAALHASTISFDLELETEHPSGPTRTMRAHVDRVSEATGWRTTITLIDDPRAAKLPPAPWRPKALVIDQNGRLTMYRADGQVARMADPARLTPARGAAAPTTSINANGMVLGTDWMDQLFVASASRATASKTMLAGASAGARDATGMDHYTKAVRTHTIDFAVDPATGVVKGFVLTDGQRTSRAAFEYMNTASGLSIRTRSHFEQAGGRFSGSRTITIQHVVVDGQEVTS